VILTNPKTPLVFGTIMIGMLAVYLTLRHPSPGPLAAAHANAVDGTSLATCEICHARAGLVQGCLRCHVEIAAQVEADRGYHAFLLRPQRRCASGGKETTCAPCHPDHLGGAFSLVSKLAWGRRDPNSFDHPHVQFALTGAHKRLTCDACHSRRAAALRAGSEPSALPAFPAQPRHSTYLGLTQDCVGCHEDVHAGVLARSCQSCHSQETFRPAVRFKHDDYYKLQGAHVSAACADCHLVTPRDDARESLVADVNGLRVAFDKVKGKACADCHQTPHRTPWSGACTACHLAADETWAKGARGMQSEAHALTGFPLDEAHATVACEKCHTAGLPYDRRYPDPRAAGYARHPKTCEGCHEDPHRGQFQGRYSGCADCHSGARFIPPQFDVARHAEAYPLRGPHAIVACVRCHPADPNTGVRPFVSVSRQCGACHTDPHGRQFAAGHAQCTDCHEQDRFLPARYDAAQHAALYPLTGAHAAVPCIRCHALMEDTSVRRFVSTPRECKLCHAEDHAGQFEREMAQGDCTACHRPDAATFRIRPYDHARQAGYPLTGAHQKADCVDCHREQRPDPSGDPSRMARVYRGTPTACDACHRDVHRGQFKRNDQQDCQRCHDSAQRWTANRFDHNRDARFKLEGVHADLDCSACHPAVRQPDGQNVVQYRPLGTRCEDCHGFTSK
jgi:hypothetical protein